MFNVFKMLVAVAAFFIIHIFRYWDIKRNFTQQKLDNFVDNFCITVLKSIGVTYEIEDRRTEKIESALYISNHNSMYDSILVTLAVKTKLSYFVAGEYSKFAKIPFIKQIVSWINLIFVDRLNIRSGFDAVKSGSQMLQDNHNLIIFAEGEITNYIIKDDEKYVGELHHGSFKPAQIAKKPVVPITIIGSDKIHSTRNMFSPIKSGHVKIIIDKPIYFEKSMMTDEMASKTREIIIENYKQNLNVDL